MRRSAALKMLFHEKATAFGSIAGVIAIIFLVGQQLAIFFGLLGYMSFLVDNSNADIWVKTQNTDNFNAGGTIPMSYRDRIMGIEGIQWAEPIVIRSGLLKLKNGNFQAVQIFGTRRPNLVGGPTRFSQGSIEGLLDGEGVTVDSLDLDILGSPSIGDIFEINSKRARVTAITKGMQGFSGFILYTNIEKARELVSMSTDRCSNILIKVEKDTNIKDMISLLKQALPKAEAISTRDLSNQTRLYYLKNTGIGSSFGLTTFISIIVGVVVIALTMYTNVLNKTRDYAVLRALGARKRDVLYIVFLQAVYIAIAGIFVGFTLLSMFLFFTKDSGLPSYLPWWMPIAHALGTILLCILGSTIAMRRAVSIEPATAFR